VKEMKGLLAESFLKRNRGERKLRGGGKHLKVVFSAKDPSAWCFRADFGRTSPQGNSETAGRSEIMRGWPAGFATARPRGPGKGNLRPGAPRCGGWFPGYGPRSSTV